MDPTELRVSPKQPLGRSLALPVESAGVVATRRGSVPLWPPIWPIVTRSPSAGGVTTAPGVGSHRAGVLVVSAAAAAALSRQGVLTVELLEYRVLEGVLLLLNPFCSISHSLQTLAELQVVDVLIEVDTFGKTDQLFGLVLLNALPLCLRHRPEWLHAALLLGLAFTFGPQDGLDFMRLNAVAASVLLLQLLDSVALSLKGLFHSLLALLMRLLAGFGLLLIVPDLLLQLLDPLAVAPQSGTWSTCLHVRPRFDPLGIPSRW
mmetsp:Transcript_32325/g.75008  ORF Transcript_32325/g.75008 Transcript_32325/m.75008 type:complete len:262 (+) Transcript_32325:221-1006(+)